MKASGGLQVAGEPRQFIKLLRSINVSKLIAFLGVRLDYEYGSVVFTYHNYICTPFFRQKKPSAVAKI